MIAKQVKSRKPAGKSAHKAHKPKGAREIAKELREQQALDPDKSEIENYLTENPRHFGL